MGEEDRGCGGRREGPLKKVYLCPFSLSWNWKYELWMPPSSRLDTVVGGLGNDSAKRLRISGVAKTPYVFYLFLRKLKRLGYIYEGGEEFDAGWG